MGGKRTLARSSGRMDWPYRGVYFFFENGEMRSGSGRGPRVVRVGTHGLKIGTKSSLWTRLRTHRGATASGRGNHRGSIFRLLVGEALARREGYPLPPTWGAGGETVRAGCALARLAGQIQQPQSRPDIGAVEQQARQRPLRPSIPRRDGAPSGTLVRFRCPTSATNLGRLEHVPWISDSQNVQWDVRRNVPRMSGRMSRSASLKLPWSQRAPVAPAA